MSEVSTQRRVHKSTPFQLRDLLTPGAMAMAEQERENGNPVHVSVKVDGMNLVVIAHNERTKATAQMFIRSDTEEKMRFASGLANLFHTLRVAK
jgi:hypothetical protein